MRRSLAVLWLIALVSNAAAQEFELPTLRGSTPYVAAPPVYHRWSGFYAGAQVGRSGANVDFSDATRSLVAFSLRELALENEAHVSLWRVLGNSNVAATNFGGFAGYNSQWDDLVLGVELNYNRSSLSAVAPVSPLNRVTSAGGNAYSVDLTGSGTMQIQDYGTARARAGWIFGNFLPYVTVGTAVGLANLSRSSLVSGVQNPFSPFDATQCPSAGHPTCVQYSFANSESRKRALIYGWEAGAGLDVMILPGVFLRGELEYIRLASVS
jgi:outer membrane immunogenic protein